MQQFFNFIVKYKYFLLFLLLESLALSFTISNHTYQKSVFISSSNSLTGGILNKIYNFDSYLDLKSNNKILLQENTQLKNLIEQHGTITTNDSSSNQKYSFVGAEVIRNEYTKPNNYLTLKSGLKDSVKIDMGVVNENGIVGIINHVSQNYATALSVLNQKSKINVKLKKSNYFGSLVWDGKDYHVLTLQNLPRQAPIAIGDTIVTGGQSTVFPKDILVGEIVDIKSAENRFTKISIKLFNDLSNIGQVYIIKNKDAYLIKRLEKLN